MNALPPNKTVSYKSFRLRVYSVGWLAHLTERTSDTVRRWERLEVLPKPILVLGGKRRWYSAAELKGYAEIFKRSNVRRKIPIESTNFRTLSYLFKKRLAAQVKIDPTVLGRTITGEETIKTAMSKAREEKWKKKVDEILKQVAD